MTDAFDDEAEQSVTIHEYLKEVEDRELEADLVLGGDDGKECTYNSGYMKRQAIFSCLTCTPDGNAGVCTACSLACHDGHQVVELWTKRNFRCDCGNSKFGEFYCKLFANKDVENVENAYNHNFKGSYCTCGRPYPDPDAVEQEEMIQCCLCEDWFHEEHLGLESSDEIPRDDEGEPLYEDFICRACSEVCSFLRLYPEAIWAAGKQQDVDIKGNEGKVASEGMPSTRGSEKSTSDACSHSSPETEDLKVKAHEIGDSEVKAPEIGDSEVKADSESVAGGKDPLQRENCAISADLNPGTKDNNLHTNCVLGVDIADAPPSTDSKPMFLCKNWRDALCKCEKCLEYYNQKKIAFLADKEDSIVEYEKIGKQKREEKLQQQEGAELNFFNKLGHVEKVEILKGIEEMKDGLRAFLDSADSSKPITAADIHQFFDDIKNKRRRVE